MLVSLVLTVVISGCNQESTDRQDQGDQIQHQKIPTANVSAKKKKLDSLQNEIVQLQKQTQQQLSQLNKSTQNEIKQVQQQMQQNLQKVNDRVDELNQKTQKRMQELTKQIQQLQNRANQS
jgi:ElaB/YqjD/DUF883 family membrane-anchored ribosome-binding protein